MANDERPGELSNVKVLATATGMTLTVIAWGVLVFAAIDYGRTARAGDGRDWLLLVAAAIGAIACMFAAIMLAARVQVMMRTTQRSSTRPLPLPLDDLPPIAERPGTAAVLPAEHAPAYQRSSVRTSYGGKRAARR